MRHNLVRMGHPLLPVPHASDLKVTLAMPLGRENCGSGLIYLSVSHLLLQLKDPIQ